MKRIGNLYSEICSVDNLILAEKKARKGKLKQYGVRLFDLNKEDNLINLHHILVNKEFKTSEYYRFKVFDGKEREIFRLPYYPDRIVHHAILNVLEKHFMNVFTADTYSCIKGRGILKASMNLREVMRGGGVNMF
jgi:RNA-directed DNA polymerase